VDWTHLTQAEYSSVGGSCENGNETLGSIKSGELLDQLINK